MTDSPFRREFNGLENEILIFCQNSWSSNPKQQTHINLEYLASSKN